MSNDDRLLASPDDATRALAELFSNPKNEITRQKRPHAGA